MKNKIRVFLGILVLIVGFKFNTIIQAGNQLHIELKKLTRVISLIEEKYVQIPEWDKVMDSAIQGIMEELDPHSVYIKKEKMEKVEEKFEGEFEGIGIEFDILDGFITVISPIAGGPAEQAGVQAGDQVIKINGEKVKGITKDEVFEKLRGPANSEVDLTIRRGNKDLEFTLTRGKIPIYSVLASTIISDSTGYIHLNRFAETTSKEVKEALDTLYNQGARQYILDLRNNSGGILQEAVEIIDFFIEGRKKVVYTKGRLEKSSSEYYSGTEYKYEKFPLIILINRGSASASEIIAGAIQDLDRGILIGERSFGKGLVQKQYKLNDGSAIRITVAKYYTPSGRLIQRPFKESRKKYYKNVYKENRDSILAEMDSSREDIKYKTAEGREVYGGGGISPDYPIKKEYNITSATQKLRRSPQRYIFKFSTNYIERNEDEIGNRKQFIENFKVNDQLYEKFIEMLEEKENNEIDLSQLDKNKQYLKTMIKAQIAKSKWGYDEYYRVLKEVDIYIQKALDKIKESSRIMKQ